MWQINISKIEYSKTEELLLSLKAQAMQKSKYLAQKLAQSVGQKAGKAIFMSASELPISAQLQDSTVIARKI